MPAVKRYEAPEKIGIVCPPEHSAAIAAALAVACRTITLSDGTRFGWNVLGEEGKHLVRLHDGAPRKEASLLAELAMCKRFADAAVLAAFITDPFVSGVAEELSAA